MTDRTADPARTHAVLVGIEKYEAGGEWNRLSGPVRDVLAFHEWLLSRKVPADQIMVLVSPLDENVSAVEQSKIKTSPATSAEVLRVLNTLQPKRGDLLFLYWAGHGIVYEEEHRLFLADATANHKRNLDLDVLKKSLRSSYFPRFPLQIIIIDACANYQRFAFTFPGEPIPCGDPLGHEQFVFFAARPGQVAKNLGEEKRGLFSQEFLRKVQELPDKPWPPDMRKLAESVQAAFTALRATSNLAQTPVYEWIRDWEGNVTKHVVRSSLEASSGQPPSQDTTFSRDSHGLSTAVGAVLPSAVTIWRQKLEFMLVEDAFCVDPAMKFRIKHLIAEAEQKIRSLGG